MVHAAGGARSAESERLSELLAAAPLSTWDLEMGLPARRRRPRSAPCIAGWAEGGTSASTTSRWGEGRWLGLALIELLPAARPGRPIRRALPPPRTRSATAGRLRMDVGAGTVGGRWSPYGHERTPRLGRVCTGRLLVCRAIAHRPYARRPSRCASSARRDPSGGLCDVAAIPGGAAMALGVRMTELLRPHAEQLFADELPPSRPPTTGRAPAVAAVPLGGHDVPARWRSAPTSPSYAKVPRPPRLVELAVATLATDRALLLLGVPGTAKTWLWSTSRRRSAARPPSGAGHRGEYAKNRSGTAGTTRGCSPRDPRVRRSCRGRCSARWATARSSD